MVDGSEGREVQLINRKSLRSLTSQLLSLLMSQEEDQVNNGLRVDVLSEQYRTVHGALLNPCEYGFLSLSELLKSLPYLVEVSGRVCLSSQSSSSLPELPTQTELTAFHFFFFHSCTMKKVMTTMLASRPVVVVRTG